MSIHAHTLEVLEFAKISERLARYTAFAASRELALALLPSTDPYEVRRRLRLTAEARRLLDEQPELSIGGARDVRSAARHAQRGGVLEASTLLEIAATLAAIAVLRTRLRKLDPDVFGLLLELAEGLVALPAVEGEITRCIGDDGMVLDSASPKLGQLRAEVRVAYDRLQQRLQAMVSSTTLSGALQEAIITVRNGRFVLPVKAGSRKEVRGLVHDQSASGATLYIEPIAIVELNNRWRELQLAEEEEVARILAELSDLVGAQADAIVLSITTLAELDLALACAKYAHSMRAINPQIVTEPGVAPPGTGNPADAAHAPLQLTQARHPLLDPQTVVPIDLWLGGGFQLLLITGPNTGGKTVALKTTGLLALMAQAGLHLPASEPSRLPIFEQIFADIGDEQSIEQSLSTFSSHMTNIVRILKGVDETPTPVLVLLDELGAGTDPVEGAALARAIAERLLERGVYGMATTHYAELKAFAYATPGVQNASVEFNVETLAPTYRLTIGLPGRSNALAIAGRIGLETTLIERARSSMAREDAQVEDLLSGIRREMELVEQERRRSEQLREDAEKYRDRLAQEWQAFEESRQNRLEAAQAEIETELAEARSELRRLRDNLRSVTVSREWLEQAEQRMEQLREQVNKTTLPPEQARTSTTQAPRPLQVGDRVLVRSVGLSGEILAIDQTEAVADVQVGGFRMRADLKELRRDKDKQASREERRYESSTVSLPPPPEVSMSLDMRGWRASDVADRLDHYLNDAFMAGLPSVRLIHGKGTGALRQIVRDVLSRHSLVRSFANGGQDGGDGVTIAELNH